MESKYLLSLLMRQSNRRIATTPIEGREMKQHDILINVNGSLEWVCGIYQDDINDAIACAVSSTL